MTKMELIPPVDASLPLNAALALITAACVIGAYWLGRRDGRTRAYREVDVTLVQELFRVLSAGDLVELAQTMAQARKVHGVFLAAALHTDRPGIMTFRYGYAGLDPSDLELIAQDITELGK